MKEKLKSQEKRPLFTRPDKAFWRLGMIAFCSMICQGAMFDWSGVYFRKVMAAEPSFTGAGYTAFMVSMTLVRFLTDWFSQKFGFEKIMVVCGLSITSGLLVAVLFPYLLPAVFGMFLVGIGVSPGVPLVFSLAGKSRTLPPPVAIAAVSSIGMIGLLIGPPIIGFVAGLTSLKTSFIMLSSFGMAIVLAALTAKKQEY